MRRHNLKNKSVAPLLFHEAIKKFGWARPGESLPASEILLGEKCNAKCLFCCAADMEKGTEWVAYPKLVSEIRKARADGAGMIMFSGGECTLHPRIEELISEAKKSGFKMIQIISNGLRLADPEFSARLVRAGANDIKISLHGIDDRTHDSLVGVPGAFGRVMAAIDIMNRLGVKVSCNFAITKMNYMQMPLFARFMWEGLGLTGFCYMFSFYEGNMRRSPEALNIRYSHVLEPLRYALRYMEAKKVVVESRILSNFVPCLAPEYRDLMSDWRRGGARGSYISKGGETRYLDGFHDARKGCPRACGECVYSADCVGVDAGYLQIYGDSEFSPVRELNIGQALKPAYF